MRSLTRERLGLRGDGVPIGVYLYEVTEGRRVRQALRFEALDAAGRVLGKSTNPRGA